jgi:copper homeostasis protein (lipoprotein)
MGKATLVISALLLSACGENDAGSGNAPPFDPTTLPGIYAGTFPCGNCPGIDVRLWLRNDGVFFMRQDYRATDEDPVERVHALGHWAWDSAAPALVLRGQGPERRFSYEEPLLKMHTLGEQPVLERDDGAGPFSDRLPLQGEYVSAGDGVGTFSECVTGLRLRVNDDARGRDLRRRHRAVSPADRPALVSIDAHLAESASTPADEVLIVDRFVALQPGSDCRQ